MAGHVRSIFVRGVRVLHHERRCQPARASSWCARNRSRTHHLPQRCGCSKPTKTAMTFAWQRWLGRRSPPRSGPRQRGSA